MAKKTLLQQMAELSKPVKDFDIEDAERDVFDHSDGDSDEEDEEAKKEEERLKTEHYVSVEKSKIRDNGIHLRDEKYKGTASTRKAIFEDSDDAEDDDHSEGDDSEDVDVQDSDDEVSQGESSVEDLSQSDDEDEEDQEEEQEDDEESVVDSEEEQSAITDSDNSDDDSDDQSTSNATREKLKQLMSQERKVILSRLSSSTQTDALKGYAVIAQQKQFDSIIDVRIKLQKATQGSNALPLNNETFEEFQDEESEELQTSAIESLSKLLNTIISLRTKIYNKEKVTKEPLVYHSKKRSLSLFLSETEKLDTILKKNRDQTLTKWSHKVQSASGSQALNASKFKTLNQGAAQQVENHLMDMERLVKRTRLNRRDVVPLGRTDDGAGEDEDDDDDNDNDELAPEYKSSVDRSLKEDRDVFDDEDFYRVLLNDLVNKKLSDSAPSGGLVITKTKVKKNIDTKASKGRKLKYTVQQPIQNYEAPKGSFKWDDGQIDEFFAGLLGQRVDFAEDSDDSEDSEEENESIKEDDLKLFS